MTLEDDGLYTCIAVNDMGSASSAASLRVLGKLQRCAGVPIFQGPQVQSFSLHLNPGPSKGELQQQPTVWDVPGWVTSHEVKAGAQRGL